MVCTIENTATIGATKVEITNEWVGGATTEMLGATGEYSVDAGSSQEFTVTFTGVTNNYQVIAMSLRFSQQLLSGIQYRLTSHYQQKMIPSQVL